MVGVRPDGLRTERTVAFVSLAVAVLVLGIALATADLRGQRGAPSEAGSVPVRLSMAGFSPDVIAVDAASPVALELWTTDAAPHLQGGVHTFIADELGIREELPAESRRVIRFTAPSTPGDYDVYCDTCCGGRASPTMHAILRVEG